MGHGPQVKNRCSGFWVSENSNPWIAVVVSTCNPSIGREMAVSLRLVWIIKWVPIRDGTPIQPPHLKQENKT